jgi:hypothetical protein
MCLGVIEEIRGLDVSVDHPMVRKVLDSPHHCVHVLPDVFKVESSQIGEEGLALLVLEYQRHLTL